MIHLINKNKQIYCGKQIKDLNQKKHLILQEGNNEVQI